MLRINQKNNAISKTTEAYLSMCKFGDHYLGVTADGVFSIGGATDNLAAIQATVRSGEFDLGTSNSKRIAYFHLGLETPGLMQFEVFCDEDQAGYTVDIPYIDSTLRNVLVKVPKALRGRYWSWELRNVDGSQFTLHSIKIIPVTLLSAR